MSRAAVLLLALLLAACARSPATTPSPPAPPPQPAVVVPTTPGPALMRAAIRIALTRAAPREAAVVADPKTDAEAIAMVRSLDHDVRHSLAELERDHGRHATPAALIRAHDAVKAMQD